jgi:hypothetical protein
VGNREDFNNAVFRAIQNVKWKSLQYGSADVSRIPSHFHQRELARSFHNSAHSRFKQIGKAIGNLRVPHFVPIIVVLNLGGGRVVDFQSHDN